MTEATAFYRMEKIRGHKEQREIYILNDFPRRIELSPSYNVGQCTVGVVTRIYSDHNFREVKLPLDLLEGIIKDIEDYQKIDIIFDTSHDQSLHPRIEKSARAINLLVGKQLGYPYYNGKKITKS